MNNVKRILVPTDFSAVSDRALEYVANLVKKDRTVGVKLLHIMEADDEHSKVEQNLEQLKSSYQHSIPTLDYQIVQGTIPQALLEVQEDMKADLIIMGTKGSTEEESEASTLTADLVLEANCPVLVVPPKQQPFSIKNIALALGNQEIDNSLALGVLYDIARAFDARVHILSILKDDQEPVLNPKNQRVLEYYLETLDYHHAFPHNSDIEEGIAEYVMEKDINMLAILPRNHATKSDPSEGRLTKLLTMHAQIPLLTID